VQFYDFENAEVKNTDMLNKKEVFLWILFLVFFGETLGAILIKHDVTGNLEFGCQWTGGSVDSGVTCICHSSAQEFFIEEGSIPSLEAQVIRIDSCNTVRFGTKAISTLRNLRHIELSNINNLYFDDSGLSWAGYVQMNNNNLNAWDAVPTLKIKIENSIIRKISSYTFQGRISSIIFKDSVVENMAPFAFSSIPHAQNVEFFNVTFVTVQAQAFKKFPIDVLVIRDSTFDILPSRSFSDMTVLESFLIKNCTFRVIKSGAFLIQNPRYFEVTDSEINLLEGEGFKVTTRGSVKIRNNVFNITQSGAFAGISLNKEVVTNEEILFDSNTFNSFQKRSLEINTTSFSAKYNNIFISQPCDCRFMNYDLEDGSDYEEFQCIFKDNEKITLKEFKEYNCSVFAGYTSIIIILGVVLILFIVIFSGLVFYFKRVYKKHSEYITDKNGKPISLIMPDGRTYRETELHVVVERADLLTTDL